MSIMSEQKIYLRFDLSKYLKKRCLIMEIGEIIMDSLHYPLDNIKALVIYIVLGIIAAFVLGVTGASAIAAGQLNNVGLGIVGIIGLIIAIAIFLLIDGYGLDVIKIGIDRENGSPEINIADQIIKGIKLLILGIVYLIIPIIIMILLSAINDTLGLIVGIILIIVFAFGLMMGECRLANTGSLGHALNIPEAFKDVTRVGIVKILAVIIVLMVLYLIISAIAGLFGNFGDIGTAIAAIISGILNTYLTFVGFRSSGLLYSEIA